MSNLWLNKNIKPMLLNEIDNPFDSKEYIYEIKFDGIRAIIYASPSSLQIKSRNNKDITKYFPELGVLKKQVKKKVIFDGEIIALENNNPSFSKVSKRLHLKNIDKIKQESITDPVVFMVFDIIYEDLDLTNKTLLERKEYLNKYKDNDVFIKTKYINRDGKKLFKSIKKLNLEGIVAKNINGFYHIGKRTDDFIKIKNVKDKDFLVGGYIHNKNNTVSLLLGKMINKKLYYRGKVLMNKNELLYKLLIKQKLSKNHFQDYNESAIFVSPKYSCVIKYLSMTKSNHLRHPVYKCMKGNL